jgi:hypothetical protein
MQRLSNGCANPIWLDIPGFFLSLLFWILRRRLKPNEPDPQGFGGFSNPTGGNREGHELNQQHVPKFPLPRSVHLFIQAALTPKWPYLSISRFL